mmetsp:Transcript_43372/g.139258  ORF Transcript_43372/g.139258 Transcript_43372/m.139258 type:complete len:228 (-) Transcript_43372:191-874(-)
MRPARRRPSWHCPALRCGLALRCTTSGRASARQRIAATGCCTAHGVRWWGRRSARGSRASASRCSSRTTRPASTASSMSLAATSLHERCWRPSPSSRTSPCSSRFVCLCRRELPRATCPCLWRQIGCASASRAMRGSPTCWREPCTTTSTLTRLPGRSRGLSSSSSLRRPSPWTGTKGCFAWRLRNRSHRRRSHELSPRRCRQRRQLRRPSVPLQHPHHRALPRRGP